MAYLSVLRIGKIQMSGIDKCMFSSILLEPSLHSLNGIKVSDREPVKISEMDRFCSTASSVGILCIRAIVFLLSLFQEIPRSVVENSHRAIYYCLF